MQRRRVLVLLVAVALVGTAGCTGLLRGDSGGQSEDATAAGQLVQRSVATMSEVETHRSWTSVSVVSEDRNVLRTSEAVVDRTANVLRANVTVQASGRQQNSTIYADLDNRTVYVREGGTWRSRQIPESLSPPLSEAERVRSMMAGQPATFVGNDTIAGTPVRVVEIDANESVVRDRFQGYVGESTSEVSVESFTFRQYIDPETGYLRKSLIEATMTVDGESVSIETTTRLLDFGTDATVEIPQAALEQAEGPGNDR